MWKWFAGSIALALSDIAAACSVVPGYTIPTNIELLAEADLVVLARVEGQHFMPDEDDFGVPLVALAPVSTLKGAAPTSLLVEGMVSLPEYGSLPEEELFGEYFKHFPTSLSEAHPSSGLGACVRQSYAEGGLILAMFRHEDGGFDALSYPFARQTEDVAESASLWVRAAILYLEVLGANPESQWTTAFASLRDALLSRGGPEDLAIAADIAAYLNQADH